MIHDTLEELVPPLNAPIKLLGSHHDRLYWNPPRGVSDQFANRNPAVDESVRRFLHNQEIDVAISVG